jgi:hypothetical protein
MSVLYIVFEMRINSWDGNHAVITHVFEGAPIESEDDDKLFNKLLADYPVIAYFDGDEPHISQDFAKSPQDVRFVHVTTSMF